MKYSDIELARMQAEALYVHDANGRLLRINEPDADGPAPRFFLARTGAGNIWRTRYDLPARLAAALERLAADEPVVNQPDRLPLHMAEYVDLLGQHEPITEIYAGPAYHLPALDPAAGTVTITPQNVDLLQAHFPYTRSSLAERAPVEAVVDDGEAVAVCFCARITAQVAEAGVYTIDGYRGRGYAAETVRAWAAAIRATGRLPLYSTAWENTASQAVAAKLGAVFYASELNIT
jgi:RimJ/RimL family protein N-acetyltransferase